jgi:hypothetical protein
VTRDQDEVLKNFTCSNICCFDQMHQCIVHGFRHLSSVNPAACFTKTRKSRVTEAKGFICLLQMLGVDMAHSKNVHSTMNTLQVYMMHKSSLMCDTGSLGVHCVLPMIVQFGNI